MYKHELIKFFGSMKAVADFLGLSRQAVAAWDDPIPEGRAYEIEGRTKGKLKVKPAVYELDNAG